MPLNRYRGPPMTLANMRAQGVRPLWVVEAKMIFEHLARTEPSGLRLAVSAAGRAPLGL